MLVRFIMKHLCSCFKVGGRPLRSPTHPCGCWDDYHNNSPGPALSSHNQSAARIFNIHSNLIR